jgi:hypothetical protein
MGVVQTGIKEKRIPFQSYRLNEGWKKEMIAEKGSGVNSVFM